MSFAIALAVVHTSTGLTLDRDIFVAAAGSIVATADRRDPKVSDTILVHVNKVKT